MNEKEIRHLIEHSKAKAKDRQAESGINSHLRRLIDATTRTKSAKSAHKAAIWLRKEVRKRRRAAINEFVRASPSFEAILSVWDAHNAVDTKANRDVQRTLGLLAMEIFKSDEKNEDEGSFVGAPSRQIDSLARELCCRRIESLARLGRSGANLAAVVLGLLVHGVMRGGHVAKDIAESLDAMEITLRKLGKPFKEQPGRHFAVVKAEDAHPRVGYLRLVCAVSERWTGKRLLAKGGHLIRVALMGVSKDPIDCQVELLRRIRVDILDSGAPPRLISSCFPPNVLNEVSVVSMSQNEDAKTEALTLLTRLATDPGSGFNPGEGGKHGTKAAQKGVQLIQKLRPKANKEHLSVAAKALRASSAVAAEYCKSVTAKCHAELSLTYLTMSTLLCTALCWAKGQGRSAGPFIPPGIDAHGLASGLRHERKLVAFTALKLLGALVDHARSFAGGDVKLVDGKIPELGAVLECVRKWSAEEIGSALLRERAQVTLRAYAELMPEQFELCNVSAFKLIPNDFHSTPDHHKFQQAKLCTILLSNPTQCGIAAVQVKQKQVESLLRTYVSTGKKDVHASIRELLSTCITGLGVVNSAAEAEIWLASMPGYDESSALPETVISFFAGSIMAATRASPRNEQVNDDVSPLTTEAISQAKKVARGEKTPTSSIFVFLADALSMIIQASLNPTSVSHDLLTLTGPDSLPGEAFERFRSLAQMCAGMGQSDPKAHTLLIWLDNWPEPPFTRRGSSGLSFLPGISKGKEADEGLFSAGGRKRWGAATEELLEGHHTRHCIAPLACAFVFWSWFVAQQDEEAASRVLDGLHAFLFSADSPTTRIANILAHHQFTEGVARTWSLSSALDEIVAAQLRVASVQECNFYHQRLHFLLDGASQVAHHSGDAGAIFLARECASQDFSFALKTANLVAHELLLKPARGWDFLLEHILQIFYCSKINWNKAKTSDLQALSRNIAASLCSFVTPWAARCLDIVMDDDYLSLPLEHVDVFKLITRVLRIPDKGCDNVLRAIASNSHDASAYIARLFSSSSPKTLHSWPRTCAALLASSNVTHILKQRLLRLCVREPSRFGAALATAASHAVSDVDSEQGAQLLFMLMENGSFGETESEYQSLPSKTRGEIQLATFLIARACEDPSNHMKVLKGVLDACSSAIEHRLLNWQRNTGVLVVPIYELLAEALCRASDENVNLRKLPEHSLGTVISRPFHSEWKDLPDLVHGVNHLLTRVWKELGCGSTFWDACAPALDDILIVMAREMPDLSSRKPASERLNRMFGRRAVASSMPLGCAWVQGVRGWQQLERKEKWLENCASTLWLLLQIRPDSLRRDDAESAANRLLGNYQGTRAPADRSILAALSALDKGPAKSAIAARGFLFGETFGVAFNATEAKWFFSTTACRAARKQAEGFDCRRVALTLADFPWDQELEPSKWIESSSQGRHTLPVTEYAGYDPSFALPAMAYCLRTGIMSPKETAEEGLAALSLCSLGSCRESVREAACSALSAFAEAIERGQRFREWKQFALIVQVAERLFDESGRIGGTQAALLAESSLAALHPESDVYPPINKALISCRERVKANSAALLAVFHMSLESPSQQARLWALSVLREGIGTSNDAQFLRKYHVPHVLAGFQCSGLPSPAESALISEIVALVAQK